MPDPTDPRAVADDHSGIVQQMPNSGDALAPCPFCGLTPKIEDHEDGCFRIDHWCNDTIMDNFIAVEGETETEVETRWNRRATDADLRAEVERLTYEVKRLREALYDVCFEYDPSDTCQNAMVMRDIARAALSPETDGGQDV